ncbi:MAG: ABC transporter permease [Acidobacteriota bacterium]
METLWQDLRYSFRMLQTNPGFMVVAIFCLALGIAANSTIFSLVNAVLLRPLPYRNSNRLVIVWGNFFNLGMERIGAKAAEFVDYREQNQSFDQIAAFNNLDFNLTGVDQPERIAGAGVTTSLFPLLDVQAKIGRTFLPEENQPGHNNVVLLSYGLWQRRFGADPNLIGKAITLDGRSYTVVGIMPIDFQFPHSSLPFGTPAELWVPLAFTTEQITERQGSYNYLVIARLKPNIELEQARADMEIIGRRLEQYNRGPNGEDGGWRPTIVLLQEEAVRNGKTVLLILLGVVALVLLIACCNVANLLLVRATARQKEIAIRIALGATRFRLIRQLLTESLLLALLGGFSGLLLAFWGTQLLVALSPENLPRVKEVSWDGRVIIFTITLSLLTGIIFGLVPALQVSKPNLNETLKEGSGSITGSLRRNRILSMLVIGEVAIAVVLLIGAGLMIKSFLTLQQVDPGLNSQGVLTIELSLTSSKYQNDLKVTDFYDQLINRIKVLPGVQSVGMSSILPLSGIAVDDPFSIEGRPLDMNKLTIAGHQVISPNYFQTLNIPFIRGHDFTPQDITGSPAVAIINEKMAETFWPNEDPLGKRIKLGAPQAPGDWITVIGVVANIPHRGLDSDPQPDWYLPHLQSPSRNMYLVVRTTVAPMSLTAAIQTAVVDIDKEQPVANMKTIDQVIATSVVPRRFNMFSLGIFATIALALAAAGIYSVISYSVAQRRREIGIRMVLGAQWTDVLKLVMRQGMTLALIGIGIGLIAAFSLTRLMSGLLYRISATDPETFVVVLLVLIVVALLACYIPTRRATKVDPIATLRCE